MMNKSHSEPWILESPLDMHLHLRQGDMLSVVAPHSARHFSGAVIMPNLVPPVTSIEMVHRYRAEIIQAAGDDHFTPYMTLFFRDYSAKELDAAQPHIIGIKLYPDGVTTNSESGIRDWRDYDHVLSMMEERSIPLLVHGETLGFVMNREREFMSVYQAIASRHTGLKIVMEHISTRESLDILDRFENLFATVTVHHLLMTLDDMAGGKLNPHLFCKPILKYPDDRDALQEAVLNGHPKIMFGSDSAPHPLHQKECCGCAAGIFSSPVAIPVLAAFFDQHNKRSLLQSFISDHAQSIYGISPSKKRIRLDQARWTVPARFGEVTPFMAGKELAWSASSV